MKSILDVGATLERLETLSVALVGFRTDAFPGFYIRDSGHPVPWRLESAEEIAAVDARTRAARPDPGAGRRQPDRRGRRDDRATCTTQTLDSALEALDAAGVRGKDVTPFLLAYFHEHTDGRSLAANVALVLSNARLAGQIAVAATA